MKKTICLVLVLLIAVMSGCVKKQNPASGSVGSISEKAELYDNMKSDGSTVTEEKTGEMFPSVVYANERAKTLTIPQNTEEAIKSLYTDALNLCKSGSKVLVPKNDYNVIFLSASVSKQVDGSDKIQEALEKKLEEMRYDDDLLFVENTADANDVYLVFLTYIESLTDYSMDLDPNYDFEKMNRMKFENFLFCAEFGEAGYGSFKELRENNVVTGGDTGIEVYTVAYCDVRVFPTDATYLNDRLAEWFS